jgi:hypothetical protein
MGKKAELSFFKQRCVPTNYNSLGSDYALNITQTVSGVIQHPVAMDIANGKN